MFKRLRQSQISLAAKCQLLFGAAVTLIIAAALWVPWQRMDQLTDQLNEKAAEAVAHTAIAAHVADHLGKTPATRPETTEPALVYGSTPAPTAASTTAPTTSPALTPDSEGYLAPRLVSINWLSTPEQLTRFEAASLSRFVKDPNRAFDQHTYKLPSGDYAYRFTQPLYARGACLACHSDAGTEAMATQPSTQQAAQAGIGHMPPLLGLVSVDISSQIDSRQLLLNRIFLFTAGLFAGTLAIVIFYLITTRLILQPVRVLQETAEKVAQGDLNIRSDINTGDEFQQLSETFNVMLINLKQSTDQLRAVNKSLDLKLGQLAESNLALYESNRLKSEFLANVSHELRTPLNSILGFAELLRDQIQPGSEAKVTRYVQNITSSGNNLLDLINDLLDLAKIEAGRMEVRSEPISLSDLFEALLSLLKPLAEPKQLTIVSAVSPDVPIVRTDTAKLQQILYNFLSNAIKFSPAGERIELQAELDAPATIRIGVSDHGPGIAADHQAVIFEKFRQLDGSVTRAHSGTGLGLAISKELSVLLGGSIELRSAPGEGATFWLRLPLRIEAGMQDVRGRVVMT